MTIRGSTNEPWKPRTGRRRARAESYQHHVRLASEALAVEAWHDRRGEVEVRVSRLDGADPYAVWTYTGMVVTASVSRLLEIAVADLTADSAILSGDRAFYDDSPPTTAACQKPGRPRPSDGRCACCHPVFCVRGWPSVPAPRHREGVELDRARRTWAAQRPGAASSSPAVARSFRRRSRARDCRDRASSRGAGTSGRARDPAIPDVPALSSRGGSDSVESTLIPNSEPGGCRRPCLSRPRE